MDMHSISGFFLGMEDKIDLPKEFKEFLSMDDQGMEGFEFMLNDPKLNKRIPGQVRMQYEVLYGQMNLLIEKEIERLRGQLDELEKNPKPAIHALIRDTYHKNDSKKSTPH